MLNFSYLKYVFLVPQAAVFERKAPNSLGIRYYPGPGVTSMKLILKYILCNLELLTEF